MGQVAFGHVSHPKPLGKGVQRLRHETISVQKLQVEFGNRQGQYTLPLRQGLRFDAHQNEVLQDKYRIKSRGKMGAQDSVLVPGIENETQKLKEGATPHVGRHAEMVQPKVLPIGFQAGQQLVVVIMGFFNVGL